MIRVPAKIQGTSIVHLYESNNTQIWTDVNLLRRAGGEYELSDNYCVLPLFCIIIIIWDYSGERFHLLSLISR